MITKDCNVLPVATKEENNRMMVFKISSRNLSNSMSPLL